MDITETMVIVSGAALTIGLLSGMAYQLGTQTARAELYKQWLNHTNQVQEDDRLYREDRRTARREKRK